MAQSLGGMGSPTPEQTVLVEKMYDVLQQGIDADAKRERVWTCVVGPQILGQCPTLELFEALRDLLYAKLFHYYLHNEKSWIKEAILLNRIAANQQWKSERGTPAHLKFIETRDALARVHKKATRVVQRTSKFFEQSGATNSGGTSGNSSSSSSSMTGSNKIPDGGTQDPRDALAAAPVPVACGRCSGAPAESQPSASRAQTELQPSASRAPAERQRQPSVPAERQPSGVAAGEGYAVILPQICKKNIKFQFKFKQSFLNLKTEIT
jgi:hypothetical protein